MNFFKKSIVYIDNIRMNIFYLSSDPEEAARMACDKHVIKMILESTQLLYTAQHVTDPDNLSNCYLKPYGVTHKNHPSAIWARSSYDNYMWLCQLALAYCEEYRYRYGSSKKHACENHLEWLYNNPPSLPNDGFWQPPQCMPDQYKGDCSIDAYRRYYIGEKLSFVRYTNREAPYWLEDYL